MYSLPLSARNNKAFSVASHHQFKQSRMFPDRSVCSHVTDSVIRCPNNPNTFVHVKVRQVNVMMKAPCTLSSRIFKEILKPFMKSMSYKEQVIGHTMNVLQLTLKPFEMWTDFCQIMPKRFQYQWGTKETNPFEYHVRRKGLSWQMVFTDIGVVDSAA